MDKFAVRGPCRLAGRVRASGAKNAALPALAASLLADEPLRLRRTPRVRDLATMRRLLAHLGVGSHEEGEALVLTPGGEASTDDAPYTLVKTMRASVLVLGPLLARRGRARVSLPGGCAIGVRPIDQHLLGLEALGAEVRLEHGYVEARAARLVGNRFRFAMPTVTGTENLLMAAALAHGTTRLENCAREPEVVDLSRLLAAMGARISGAGSETIEIEGVERSAGATHTVISDRIEGGTYLIGAALTDGDVVLEDASRDDLGPLLAALEGAGAVVTAGERRDPRARRRAATARHRHRPAPRFPHRPAGAMDGADDPRAPASRRSPKPSSRTASSTLPSWCAWAPTSASRGAARGSSAPRRWPVPP